MRHSRQQAARELVISTTGGPVSAWQDAALIRAPGITYARAARWQPPQPLLAGLRPGSPPSRARACPQLPVPRLDALLPDAFRGICFDEDCLDLSVTAPAGGRDLPVMVWFHGGSYESGAADMGVFDPAALVAEQQVVVVAVSHRLGLLGWLGGAGRPANLGALDAIAALDWIALNIAAFGGDPGRVTLFGQSSGGDLAARLMMVATARALFHRAIIQSAPLHLPLGTGRMRRAMRRAAVGLDAEAPLAEILARQAQVRHAVRLFGLAGQMPFGPEFGAAPFPAETVLAQAHAAAAPAIPILIGHARDEAALFLPPAMRGPARIVEPVRRLLVRRLTRHLYARPAQSFARRHRAAGGHAVEFVIEWPGGAWGCAHLSDLPLLFPGPDWLGTPLVPASMDLAELTRTGAPLRRIWADFARAGRVGELPPGAGGVVRINAPETPAGA